jgi:hypothetical protein
MTSGGSCRGLHNEELRNLYDSPNIRAIKSKGIAWTGRVIHMGEMRSACNILIGNHEGKRLLGRPRRRWENNIRMDLTEVGWEGLDWMHLA